MHRGKDDDKPHERSDTIDHYIASLLAVFRYARIWPAESLALRERLLSTVATSVLIAANFLLLLSELAALTPDIDLEMFAKIISSISMHNSNLVKWCYCIWRGGEIVSIVMKLQKCHVLCQRINNCEKGIVSMSAA
jgi:hypothetical protein